MTKPRKRPRRRNRRTDDRHIEGVERIDAPPEEIARSMFEENRKPARPHR